MPPEPPRRRILVIVEDAGLAELLLEILLDAGHEGVWLDEPDELERWLAREPFAAAIVDLDTRSRAGEAQVAELRLHAPETRVIGLLACGGRPGSGAAGCDVAIEKPARMGALLDALGAG